jgi:hypothetical protein
VVDRSMVGLMVNVTMGFMAQGVTGCGPGFHLPESHLECDACTSKRVMSNE